MAVAAVGHDVLGTVFAGFSHLASLSTLQLGEGTEERIRTTDPLISAVGAAARFWVTISGRSVELIQRRGQGVDSGEDRVGEAVPRAPRRHLPFTTGLASELTDVRLVDSKHDSRVQVADLLAGIGRIVGESMINEQQHPLAPGLVSMLSGASLWPLRENMNVENAREVMLAQF